MKPAMNGPVFDRLSGLQDSLTGGQENHREVALAAAVPTAIDLLARKPSGHHGSNVAMLVRHSVAVRPEDTVVVLANEWLDDLHSPTLVITRGYIGPERRPSERGVPFDGASVLGDTGSLRTAWIRRVALIVCMTMAVAVPLTIISARSVPSASSAGPRASASTDRSGTTPVVSSARQAARAVAAYQRALARQEAGAGRNPRGPATLGSVAHGRGATR
jgi:hypothetical protein